MGAIQEPTPAMSPWWGVEVRGESFYLTAGQFARPANRRYLGGDATTDAERATAWRVDGGILTAPGPATALLAALTQAIEHPAYKDWARDHEAAGTTVTAAVQGDRTALVVPAHVYGKDADDGYVACVELEYQHLAALHAAVAEIA